MKIGLVWRKLCLQYVKALLYKEFRKWSDMLSLLLYLVLELQGVFELIGDGYKVSLKGELQVV